MGAPRLSPFVRQTLQDAADGAKASFTAQDGTIDRKGLAAHVLRAVRGNVAVYAALTDEARGLAVESLIADRYRDVKRKARIGNRQTTIRETYSVPLPGGAWITKSIDDLTQEDFDRLAQYNHKTAMRHLRAMKDVQILRGFEPGTSPAQMVLDDGEFAELMEGDGDANAGQ